MSLTDDIKALAIELGFHAVGVTTAEPFAEYREDLRDRMDRGLLDGLGYTEDAPSLRSDPANVLASARSVVSVALSYATDDDATKDDGAVRGRMARFAWGLDYHSPLRGRLAALEDGVRRMVGQAEMVSIADSGRLSDRAAALRSGIGCRGRNSCVYAERYGSWVALGELVTSLELDPDPPSPSDVCRGCSACYDACPTGAIVAPYTVDARRCLSQVTQSKGFIPREIRPKLGDRIYGCDACQSVCPMNLGAATGGVEELRPTRGLGPTPELIPLANITQAEFRERVGPTTAGWIRRTRFRRNVIVALGNIGDPSAIPALVEALTDPSPLVRGHAAWALGRIEGRAARPALESAIRRESDGMVIEEIEAALRSASD